MDAGRGGGINLLTCVTNPADGTTTDSPTKPSIHILTYASMSTVPNRHRRNSSPSSTDGQMHDSSTRPPPAAPKKPLPHHYVRATLGKKRVVLSKAVTMVCRDLDSPPDTQVALQLKVAGMSELQVKEFFISSYSFLCESYLTGDKGMMLHIVNML